MLEKPVGQRLSLEYICIAIAACGIVMLVLVARL
jgi:hypothetical protein